MSQAPLKLLLCGACLYGSAALSQATSAVSPQQQTPATQAQQGTTDSACVAQQKGLEAELDAIDKMTSAKAAEPAEKPKKKSKVEKVVKAVAGAAVSVLLPPAANTILQAGKDAAKGAGETAESGADEAEKAEAQEADSPAAAPAADVPALHARRQEIERRLAAIKQGVCTL